MSEKQIHQKHYAEHKAKSQGQKARFLNDKDDPAHPPQMRNAQRFFRKPKTTQELIVLPQPSIQYVHPYVPKPTPIPEAIKQIDKKIMAYRRLMERERQEQLMREQQEQERQLENEDDQKRAIDFMTNPQIQGVEIQDEEVQEEEMETIVQEPKQQEVVANRDDNKCSYSEAVKRENKLMIILCKECMKKIEPNFICQIKKKPPILNITARNKITKGYGKLDPQEHLLRVYNRENVPVMPELIIPSFTIKKTKWPKHLSLLGILKEYTPLFRGYKNYEYPKCVQNILQEEIEALPNQ